MTNEQNNETNPFFAVKVFSAGKKTNVNGSSQSISAPVMNSNKTAFPLNKLIYGGISSQFLGVVSPNFKANNDNHQKSNLFPF